MFRKRKTDLKRLLRPVIVQVLNICVHEMNIIISKEIRRSQQVWTRKWIDRRNIHGATECLIKELAEEDSHEYFRVLRMSEESFNILLNKLACTIQRSDTLMREAIPAAAKLQAVLYYLATGNSLRSLEHLFRISKSSLSRVIPEVCDAIYKSLKDYIKVPQTEEDWKKIENGFNKKWNFPGCCGAIDGKHVVIKAPIRSGSLFFNYKKTNSIVLLAVVDDDYCFSYIDVGCNGRISDGGVFRNSSIFAKLESGILPDGTFLIGDEAFPLKTYLLKPFPGMNLTTGQKIFNYRLSRARRIVENAFGILASKFRVFEKPIPFGPEKVDKIVKACCAIHNWLRKDEKMYLHPGSIDMEDTANGILIPGSWRIENSRMVSLPTNVGNHSSQNARDMRDRLVLRFLGPWQVPWQIKMIQ